MLLNNRGLVAFCAAVAAAWPQATLRAEPDRRYNLSAIEAELARQCGSGEFSGVVVVRIRGRQVLEKACGEADIINKVPVTRATRFKIYSTSKFLTALAVMRLIEQGKMQLDRPITDYVPDAPPTWSVVTVRHLLNHTSGLADFTGELVYHFRKDHPSAMRAFLPTITAQQAALSTKPGETFRYNNFGFELLADAGARAGGAPFATILQDLVFKPAGMKTASVEPPSVEAGHLVPVSEDGLAYGYNGEPGKLKQAVNWAFVQLGAGAVRATVDDFVALDEALKAGKLISQKSWQEMQRNPVYSIAADGTRSSRGFGLGIFQQTVDGVRMIGHTGGNNGYISEFQRFPDQDAMMIVLTNHGFTKTAFLREGVAKALKTAG